MEEGEKKIRQEDCSEDKEGPGILTLTNRRLAFDKTKGRIMDFKKEFGETVINVPLKDVTKVWKEGLLMKKVCFTGKKICKIPETVATRKIRKYFTLITLKFTQNTS